MYVSFSRISVFFFPAVSYVCDPIQLYSIVFRGEKKYFVTFSCLWKGKIYRIMVDSVENDNLNIHISQYNKSSKRAYPHGQ